jgi:hypothetical protein
MMPPGGAFVPTDVGRCSGASVSRREFGRAAEIARLEAAAAVRSSAVSVDPR